jgi:hypothetical protein
MIAIKSFIDKNELLWPELVRLILKKKRKFELT